MKTFKEVKKEFKLAFQEILSKKNSLIIDEAALPAYAHKNPFIDYLFWKRIEVAFEYANKNKYISVLDFGCGSGVLSYLFAENGYEVTACDLEFDPLMRVKEKISFSQKINFVEGDILKMNFQNNSFDLIVALDVLEHVENLEDNITLFKRILKPNGSILVSGPTENIFYKIGRKIAGQRFTGDYHVTNISNIKKKFSLQLEVKTIRKLIFPVILFEIFSAK